MPDAAKHTGQPAQRGSGWWMSTLLERLKLRGDLELAVVTAGRESMGRGSEFTFDRVTYFITRTPTLRLFAARLGCTAAWRPSRRQLNEFASIVNAWNPDVVHIHGTEMDYGLIKAWGLISKPVAVSIQGLMTPYARNAFGSLLPVEIHGAMRSLLWPPTSTAKEWRWLRARSPLEEEILRSADMVFGRTEWDRAWAWAYNPHFRYRHVDELMRREFYDATPWSMSACQRHRIVCTSANQALKGLHVLVEAVRRLRQVYLDVQLHIAGSGFVPQPKGAYARFMKRQINAWKLEGTVRFLGHLDAGGIAEQLRQANCYVTPSFIENGCNALQEAMLVGTPCVATLSGGMLTSIDPGRTGLAFPAGDTALLAWQIAKIFNDNDLSSHLGAQARLVARERHDPARVEEQLMSAYMEIAAH